MQIDEGLDTGPVYLCERTTIQTEETIQQLSERLADLGGDLMVRTLSGIVSGSLEAMTSGSFSSQSRSDSPKGRWIH